MRKAEDGDGENTNPYSNLQKGVVLRELNAFHVKQLDPSKCIRILTKIFYLVNQGDAFTKEEATEIFFSCTKLFQSDNFYLRRMNYMVLREIIPSVSSDQTLIAISCLNKDMISKITMFRSNALRLLGVVVDPALLSAVDRLLRQAFVDSTPDISSAAFLAGYAISLKSPQVTKQWASEISAGISSSSALTQLLALRLGYVLKSNDRVSLRKAILNHSTRPNIPDSVLGLTQQIRVVARLLKNDLRAVEFLPFLVDQLRHKSTTVSYEAARSICEIACHAMNISLNDPASASLVSPFSSAIVVALSTLRDQLRSPSVITQFAAAKVVQMTGEAFPTSVSVIAPELERLINSPNRSLGAICVATLLRAGTESSLDRLATVLTTLVNEAGEELRVSLLHALSGMAMRYPARHPQILAHMLSVLRDEGGLAVKQASVDGILAIVDARGPSFELALDTLAEYIEDCEFPQLSVKVLQKLAELGPRVSHPSRFVRMIFNRTVLEHASVRAAAVSALGRFAAVVPGLRHSLCILFRRAMVDNDDEVRDRAAFYLSIFSSFLVKKKSKSQDQDQGHDQGQDQVQNDSSSTAPDFLGLLINADSVAVANADLSACHEDSRLVGPSLPSIEGLEKSLEAYLTSGNFETQFSPSSQQSIAAIAAYQREHKSQQGLSNSVRGSASSTMGSSNLGVAVSPSHDMMTSSLMTGNTGTGTGMGTGATPTNGSSAAATAACLKLFPQAVPQTSMSRDVGLQEVLQRAFPSQSGQIPDAISAAIEAFGPLWSTTSPAPVSDPVSGSTEYSVHVVKYIFQRGVLLEYTFGNLLSEFAFKSVNFSVQHLDSKSSGSGKPLLSQVFSVQCNTIQPESSGVSIVGLASSNPDVLLADLAHGSLHSKVSFRLSEFTSDNQDSLFDDDDDDDECDTYTLDSFPFTVADLVQKPTSYIGVNTFKQQWTDASNTVPEPSAEVVHKLAIGSHSIQDALSRMLNVLGLGFSDPVVVPTGVKAFSVNLIGTLPQLQLSPELQPQGPSLILSRVGFSLAENEHTSSQHVVHVKIGIRSNMNSIAQFYSRSVLDGSSIGLSK